MATKGKKVEIYYTSLGTTEGIDASALIFDGANLIIYTHGKQFLCTDTDTLNTAGTTVKNDASLYLVGDSSTENADGRQTYKNTSVSVKGSAIEATSFIGNASTATSSTTATNIAAGAQGSIPYQTGSGTTAFLSATTNNGWILAYNTETHAPYWKVDENSNTWRGMYIGGISKVGNSVDTAAINFVAGSNVSIDYVPAGTDAGQTGSASYFNVKINAADTTYSEFVKSGANAARGLVPKPPTTANTAKFLREDATWAVPEYTQIPSNNVTGSGTSNYIAKWSGANTITNGPAFGSSTTTFLRNDGSWVTPTDTNTWRPVQCNGTSIGNNTLNLKSGTNISLSNSNGVITITSSYTDTNNATTQTDNNDSANRPVLMKNGTGTGTVTSGVLFADGVTVNPSNNSLSVSGPASFGGNVTLSTDNTGISGIMGGGTDGWGIQGTGTGDNGRLKIYVGDNGTTDWMDFEFRDYTGTTYTPLSMTGNQIKFNYNPTVSGNSLIHAGNISSQSVNYATSAGSANSVAWGNVTGKPSTFAPSSHNHDGRYSYAHQSSFAFNAAHDSNYVTFDQSNPAGSPGNAWYNGFVSTHNNYLSSYIINAHRTANWYVGYSENTTAPTWYTLIHSGNIGSQSVNYANSAGSVSWTNVSMANRDVTLTNSEGRAQVHISKSYAIFGYNNCDGGLSTYVDGRQIYFRVGSNWTTAVTINSSAQTTFSGNVSTGSYSITTGGVSASGTSNRLIFRHLDGQNCNGDYNLYLQYHQSNAVTYFNGGTYYIKGGYYNGTAAAANSVSWSNVTGKDYPTFTSLIVQNDSCNNSNDALAYFRHYSTNDWTVKIDDGGKNYGLYVCNSGSQAVKIDGNLTCTNAYTSSDRRLKKNIKDISELSLERLYDISDKLFKSFTWKQTGKESYGFIAQEMEKWIPEAIQEDREGIKSVSYEIALCKILAAVIHEMKKRK